MANAMSQVMSRAALDAAVYLASAVLSVTVRCRIDSHCTGAPFAVMMAPVTDRRVSLS
jgi:hypothetical protein